MYIYKLRKLMKYIYYFKFIIHYLTNMFGIDSRGRSIQTIKKKTLVHIVLYTYIVSSNVFLYLITV